MVAVFSIARVPAVLSARSKFGWMRRGCRTAGVRRGCRTAGVLNVHVRHNLIACTMRGSGIPSFSTKATSLVDQCTVGCALHLRNEDSTATSRGSASLTAAMARQAAGADAHDITWAHDVPNRARAFPTARQLSVTPPDEPGQSNPTAWVAATTNSTLVYLCLLQRALINPRSCCCWFSLTYSGAFRPVPEDDRRASEKRSAAHHYGCSRHGFRRADGGGAAQNAVQPFRVPAGESDLKGPVHFKRTCSIKCVASFGLAQGLAAGLMLCISMLDLMPQAVEEVGFASANMWFFAGVAFFAVIVQFIPEPSSEGLVLDDDTGPGSKATSQSSTPKKANSSDATPSKGLTRR